MTGAPATSWAAAGWVRACVAAGTVVTEVGDAAARGSWRPTGAEAGSEPDELGPIPIDASHAASTANARNPT